MQVEQNIFYSFLRFISYYIRLNNCVMQLVLFRIISKVSLYLAYVIIILKPVHGFFDKFN